MSTTGDASIDRAVTDAIGRASPVPRSEPAPVDPDGEATPRQVAHHSHGSAAGTAQARRPGGNSWEGAATGRGISDQGGNDTLDRRVNEVAAHVIAMSEDDSEIWEELEREWTSAGESE